MRAREMCSFNNTRFLMCVLVCISCVCLSASHVCACQRLMCVLVCVSPGYTQSNISTPSATHTTRSTGYLHTQVSSLPNYIRLSTLTCHVQRRHHEQQSNISTLSATAERHTQPDPLGTCTHTHKHIHTQSKTWTYTHSDPQRPKGNHRDTEAHRQITRTRTYTHKCTCTHRHNTINKGTCETF